MTDHDLQAEAADLHEQLPPTANLSQDEIEDKLSTLVGEYQVPLDEARRSVRNSLTEETDAEQGDFNGQDQAAAVEDIDDDEQWVDLTAKVVELWEPRSDSIAQVGLLGDETGRIKFTAWATSRSQAALGGHSLPTRKRRHRRIRGRLLSQTQQHHHDHRTRYRH